MSVPIGAPLRKVLIALAALPFLAATPAVGAPPADASVLARNPASFKDYTIGGALALREDVGYAFISSTGPVRLDIGRITNESTTTTSGSVRAALFLTATASPTAPGTTLYTIALSDLGVLQPGFFFGPLSHTVPYLTPPDGIYFVHMGAFEYEPGTCNASDGYCLDDFVSFSNRVQVLNGQVFDAGAPPAATDIAIEYYHTPFDHYFVTSFDNEIALLDAGRFQGWSRTGRSFNVWVAGSTQRHGVCRFFSPSFAPRSSHFYTPFADECQTVRNNPAWTFEGVSFYVEHSSANGSCPGGTQPLYRLYNNGMSGAPNHRYTTSLVVRNDMLNQGWVSEGLGPFGVIACVPL